MVDEAAEEQDDAYATAVLSRLLKHALQADSQLREELSAMLPVPAGDTGINITASGERSIAGQHIGMAFTGDVHTPPRP